MVKGTQQERERARARERERERERERATAVFYSSYSSSHSSVSYYPSSCSSISPPRPSYYQPLSPPPRRLQASEHSSAREHLASLIRKHGPPTPVSSSSSLRKLTSTSPINSSFLPPDLVETPPASPSAIEEETYGSSAGSQPIPIPRANLNRSFDDFPITPLTGRFEYGLYLTERPPTDWSPSTTHHTTRSDKGSRKKKSRSATSSALTSASAHSTRSAKRMPHSSGPSIAMPASPKPAPTDGPMYLGNLPRFHPAVYQSPNNTPNAMFSNSTSNHHPKSFGYRVASGGGSREREALRQYRELVTASLSSSRNAIDSDPEISAPRLDPLGSPGPVTPLALEEADNYMSTKPNDLTPSRQLDLTGERERSPRNKDNKRR